MKTHSASVHADRNYDKDSQFLTSVQRIAADFRYNLLAPNQNLTNRIAQVPLVPPSWISVEPERRNQYG
jgi:hypothetical protein